MQTQQFLNSEVASLPPKSSATTSSFDTSLSSGQELQQEAPASKLFQFLLNEHANAREIFHHYRFDVTSLEDRLSCVKQFCSVLLNHMLLEEKILYPVIRSRVKDGEFMYDRLMLDDLQTRESLILAQHHAKNATVNTIEFDKLVTKLIVNELEHLQEEEETVIPALEQVISKEESDQLELQLQQMKQQQLAAQEQHLKLPAAGASERKAVFKMMLPLRYVTDKGGSKAVLTTIGGQQVPYGPASILSNLSIGRLHQNETYVNALRQQDVHSLWDLWQSCLSVQNRLDMQKKTGIPIDELNKLVQRVDLMRVKGVGMDYSELLVTAGVFSVGSLARSDAVELVKAIDAANQLLKLPKQPTLEIVQSWIKRASHMHDLLETSVV